MRRDLSCLSVRAGETGCPDPEKGEFFFFEMGSHLPHTHTHDIRVMALFYGGHFQFKDRNQKSGYDTEDIIQ